MARRIEVFSDPNKDKVESALSPTDIEIETRDGNSYKKSVESVKGHPDDPMSFADLTKRLRDCAVFSARSLSD